MAKLPSNMERHPNYAGMYIAYDKSGLAWRVQRKPKGFSHVTSQWYGIPSHAGASTDRRSASGRTLEEVAEKIGASEH